MNREFAQLGIIGVFGEHLVFAGGFALSNRSNTSVVDGGRASNRFAQ